MLLDAIAVRNALFLVLILEGENNSDKLLISLDDCDYLLLVFSVDLMTVMPTTFQGWALVFSINITSTRSLIYLIILEQDNLYNLYDNLSSCHQQFCIRKIFCIRLQC